MNDLQVATMQFENASGDKAFNLARIEALAEQAAAAGARVAAFHECSVTGYTFARRLSREQLAELAEPIPDGPSVKRLAQIAARLDIYLLAGLFEQGEDGELYKAQVCVGPQGLVAKHRKLHPFINPHLAQGSAYTVFEIDGWKCGILICYDNNVIENVRATALLGAEILFMPHVTMCTPSTRPGAGFVDPVLWRQRQQDPTSLRIEFEGLKGRGWLMKWLPARAYDNGVYVVFSNPIGMDDDQLKNGCSMILDPFGDILAEGPRLDEGMALARLSRDKLALCGGHRYRQARRPELYREILGQPHEPRQQVAWMAGKAVEAD
ncbi:nitrilase-related carbon-nitrogen hydrolase [Chromobacterium sp. IIBBL 290-4]|uniref:nitrilase-related carbon-nitrogen hydrolase n=1 Tax=Chromobacterium sp. IIBBL 290-4 TaxID=2953890 RepID=UPI0020B65A6F|nr:nitrilase-related carbon-nitrogen hydrolase [Chromobacterium sp. IIBBL 290-4]UTH75942.1 acyltransferase [Chromobacterium sp. IIBBL 290-4]